MSVVSEVRPEPLQLPEDGAAPSAPSPRTRAALPVRVLRRLLAGVLTLVLVGSVGIFAFLAVGPHLLGYRTMTMLTGSMAPEIVPGDVVVIRPVDVHDLAVGDVITYHIPVEDHRVETHRIVEVVDQPGGRVAVRTQGDANPNVDPWLATMDGETAWRVSGVVPALGSAVRFLREPWIADGVRWLALAGLVGLGITTIWSRGDSADDTDVTDGTGSAGPTTPARRGGARRAV